MSIIIKTKTSEIEKKIQNAFYRHMYNELFKISQDIKKDIIEFNISLWKSSPTYQSLISGQLNHEFGFPIGTAQSSVDYILTRLARSTGVVPKLPRRVNSENKRVVSFRIFNKSIKSETFAADEANINTGKTTGSDFASDFGEYGATEVRKTLPWLKWLLYDGNSYLVYNYEYLDVVSDRSRSGRGIMVYEKGSAWRVPPEYSGTKESNWITKALEYNIDIISKKYTEIIQRRLGIL